ncbi:TraM recognition domain-containing protein [Viridibacillus arvi]|uniref:TraM recognition domain-containing protein n=1 Tax=Viridibacillus arvi TaxID=263475 RepID=UPI0034D01246
MTFDLEIGTIKNRYFKKSLYLKEHNRCVGNLVLGPMGSGKTMLLLNGISQDLQEMKYRQKNGGPTNAVTLLVPEASVCDRVKIMAENEGIQRVTYFNPEDVKSHKINPFQGDFNSVVKAFLTMFEDYIMSLDDFHAALAKESLAYILFVSKYSGEQVLDLQLVKSCLQNPRILMNLVWRTIGLHGAEDNMSSIKDEEKYNLVKGLKIWWKSKIKLTIQNNELVYSFKVPFIFKSLKELVQDLTDNPFVHNIFTTEENEMFDFEDHFKNGGLVLINTSKEHLEQFSSMIGKYFLSRIESVTHQKGVVEPNSPIHHLVIDESHEYIYKDFIALLALTRKYSLSVTMAFQSLQMVSNKYGEDMVDMLLACLRNKFIFPGIGVYDARLMASIIGLIEGGETSKISKNLIMQDAFNCTVILAALRSGDKVSVKEVKMSYLKTI